MLKRRKPPKGCSIAFFVLLLFIILLYVFVYSDTREMPDDSDLRLVYEDIPDEENAFAHLMTAAANIDLTPEEESCLDTADRDGFWDAELAEAIVAKNEKAIEEYKAALACTRSQAPPVHALDMEPSPEPEGIGLKELKRVLEQHVRSIHASGDEEAAFDAALDLVRCGDLIKRSKGNTLAFYIGSAIQRDGLDLLTVSLADTALDPGQLGRYIAALEPFTDDGEAWANMYRGEYTSAALMAQDIFGSQVRQIAPDGSGDESAQQASTQGAWSIPFIYQPRKTTRMLAESYRPLVDNTTGPYCEILRSLPEPVEYGGFFSMMLTGNALGSMVCSLVTPVMGDTPQRMCLSRTDISATQIIIALKCHEMKTGALPESLDELVPEYFEAVPLDYFDGKPIKYVPEKRLVYCVGPDLEDTGGVGGDDPSWEIR
jgi:hypothetical protein